MTKCAKRPKIRNFRGAMTDVNFFHQLLPATVTILCVKNLIFSTDGRIEIIFFDKYAAKNSLNYDI